MPKVGEKLLIRLWITLVQVTGLFIKSTTPAFKSFAGKVCRAFYTRLLPGYYLTLHTPKPHKMICWVLSCPRFPQDLLLILN